MKKFLNLFLFVLFWRNNLIVHIIHLIKYTFVNETLPTAPIKNWHVIRKLSLIVNRYLCDISLRIPYLVLYSNDY